MSVSDPIQAGSLVGGAASPLFPVRGPVRAKNKNAPEPVSGERASSSEGASASEQSRGVQSASAPSAAPIPGTYLRFKVDADTDSMTVLIIDAASGEVMRTVPPEELAKMGYDRIVDLLT